MECLAFLRLYAFGPFGLCAGCSVTRCCVSPAWVFKGPTPKTTLKLKNWGVCFSQLVLMFISGNLKRLALPPLYVLGPFLLCADCSVAWCRVSSAWVVKETSLRTTYKSRNGVTVFVRDILISLWMGLWPSGVQNTQWHEHELIYEEEVNPQIVFSYATWNDVHTCMPSFRWWVHTYILTCIDACKQRCLHACVYPIQCSIYTYMV